MAVSKGATGPFVCVFKGIDQFMKGDPILGSIQSETTPDSPAAVEDSAPDQIPQDLVEIIGGNMGFPGNLARLNRSRVAETRDAVSGTKRVTRGLSQHAARILFGDTFLAGALKGLFNER